MSAEPSSSSSTNTSSSQNKKQRTGPNKNNECEVVRKLLSMDPYMRDQPIPDFIHLRLSMFDLNHQSNSMFKRRRWTTKIIDGGLLLFLNWPYRLPTKTLNDLVLPNETIQFNGLNANELNQQSGQFSFYYLFVANDVPIPLEILSISDQVKIALLLVEEGSKNALNVLQDALTLGAYTIDLSHTYRPLILHALVLERFDFVEVIAFYSYNNIPWQLDSKFQSLQQFNGKSTMDIFRLLISASHPESYRFQKFLTYTSE